MKVARCGKSGKKHGMSHGKTWISPQIFRFGSSRPCFFPAPRLRKQLAAEIIGLGKPTIIFLLNGGGSAQISIFAIEDDVDFGKFPEADVEHMEVS